MKSILTLTAATVALATSAMAQESTTFDMDEEGRVSVESFTAGFDEMGTYDAWDADGDGMLSRDEFNQGVFTRYDADEDAYWNSDEVSAMHNDSIWDLGDEQAQDEAQTNN